MLQWFLIFFKKTSGANTSNSGKMQNQQSTEELHKPIIQKVKHFKENIYGADLADMQVIRKHDKSISCFLCVIDIYRKYSWAVPL